MVSSINIGSVKDSSKVDTNSDHFPIRGPWEIKFRFERKVV